MSDKTEAATRSALSTYWVVYGGWRALILSKYFWIAIFLTAALYGVWVDGDARKNLSQAIIDIVPSLLGFSVGAMAILMVFSQSRFFEVLSEGGKPDSAFLDLGSKFVHFVLVQTAAILAGMFVKAYPNSMMLGIVATFLLNYAVMTAVATALALFGMAEIYNAIIASGAHGAECCRTNKCKENNP
jgi:hypothetical protein